jgi:hypothetical protein
MKSFKISIHPPLCKTWKVMCTVCVRCSMHNDGKWFPFWCDWQRFVFLTPKHLMLQVRVGSIQHHRIIFFVVAISVPTESQYTEWIKVVTEDGPEYIQCVLMVTIVFSDISFDAEQNQYLSIYYLITARVGVNTFHIKYLQTSWRWFTYVARTSYRE